MAPRVGLVSLGCPKALVDSEQLVTLLKTEGYDIAPDYSSASVVVVNTCGFIESAIEESLDSIGEALAENGKVIVTGCLGKDRERILQSHPAVLAITGPHDAAGVLAAVQQYLPVPTAHPAVELPAQGIKLTPRHYGYLKISEGCNHKCTFCIIPQLRGPLVSRPIHEVLAEAEAMVKAGTQEILVISQDTAAYGMDMRYRTGFWQGQPLRTRFRELVGELGKLGAWVRLHYVYPYPHVDEVLEDMAQGRILPYLDVPLQHASPRILKAMKRPGDIHRTLERVHSWRRACPDITLRSTFIVGFPGETEEDFEALLGFLQEAQLDRVGCFTYSAVDGAPANLLDSPVPEEVKLERQARLMELQAEISTKRLQAKVGTTQEVLVDEVGNGEAWGRTRGDAPEIDGGVHITTSRPVRVGQRIEVSIEGSDQHDLYGHLV
jgi:ribosomal protein S12 methylthiotransferase